MDEWDSVCADLPYRDDVLYLYLCDSLSVYVLSLDAKIIILSLEKRITKGTGIKQK